MALTEFQKAFLKNILIPITNVIDPNTGEPVEIGAGSALSSWRLDFNEWAAQAHVNWNSLIVGHRHSSGAQNAEVTYEGMTLAAGTWVFAAICNRSTNHGIISVQLDGVTVGTIDLYSTSQADFEASTAPFIVEEAGVYQLKLLMATKNASSGGFFGLFRDPLLRRTA